MSIDTDLTMGAARCAAAAPASAVSAAKWYVVETKPMFEQFARDNIVRGGFTVFLPLYRRVRRKHDARGRRGEAIFRPVFPRYLFTSFALELREWRRISTMHGVVRLICAGEHPLAVPTREVEALQARCVESEIGAADKPKRATVMPLPEPAQNYEPGQALRIIEGPFADQVARFVGADAECVRLLLDLMGRSVRITIPCDQVAAAV